MKIISTNIGEQKEVMWRGQLVRTGIYKEPVASLKVRKFHVDGDHVSDLTVHGGEYKAVYGYPMEHYAYWKKEFPKMEMPWGMFGENITTEGITEKEMMVGSIYQIGTAILKATEPRMPCYKLAMKFGTVEMIRKFLMSRRSGFYFTVVEEGEIKPGDEIKLIEQGPEDLTIFDMVSQYGMGQ